MIGLIVLIVIALIVAMVVWYHRTSHTWRGQGPETPPLTASDRHPYRSHAPESQPTTASDGAALLRSLRLPEHLLAGLTPSPTHAIVIAHGTDQPVKGTSFHQQALLAVLGQRVGWRGNAALVPEPDNPYDPHAVAVWAEGHRIGYVAKERAALLQKEIADRLSRVGAVVATSASVFRTGHASIAAAIQLGDHLDLG